MALRLHEGPYFLDMHSRVFQSEGCVKTQSSCPLVTCICVGFCMLYTSIQHLLKKGKVDFEVCNLL